MPKLNIKFAITIAFCFAYFGLSACGTKGPLYIPEQRYPQKEDSKIAPEQNQPDAASPTTGTPAKAY